MSRIILQVPMTKDLKEKAQAAVSRMGFSSLQESIRVWLTQIIRETPMVRYEEPAVQLSKRAAARYDKMIRDIDSGKTKLYVAHSANDLLDQLHGRKPKVPSDLH